MFERIFKRCRGWIGSLPTVRRSWQIYPDCFSRSEDLLLAGMVDNAIQRAANGERVLLVAQFPDGFLSLEKQLTLRNASFSVAPPRLGIADILGQRLVLAIGTSLLSLGENDPAANWQLADGLRGRLNVMVFQRHPLDQNDEAMLAGLRRLPMHVRVGYFLSLDDPLVEIGVHETLITVLHQLGLEQHQLISSQMLTRRVQATQRRIKRVVHQPQLADSAREWLAINLPDAAE